MPHFMPEYVGAMKYAEQAQAKAYSNKFKNIIEENRAFALGSGSFPSIQEGAVDPKIRKAVQQEAHMMTSTLAIEKIANQVVEHAKKFPHALGTVTVLNTNVNEAIPTTEFS